MRHFKYTCFVRQAAGTAFVTNRANILSSKSVTKIWQEAQLALANDKYQKQVALITRPKDKKHRLPPVLQEGKASLGFLFSQVSAGACRRRHSPTPALTPPPPKPSFPALPKHTRSYAGSKAASDLPICCHSKHKARRGQKMHQQKHEKHEHYQTSYTCFWPN